MHGGSLIVFDYKYFLALIIFTVLTRLVLFPFNLKQQKIMAKTSRLQPKIAKIQKKYANSTNPQDRQRQQEEIQELYSREGHNPMNMGCGTTIFQMVFLMGIIGIIYYPIQYIIGVDIASQAQNIADVLGIKSSYFQIELCRTLILTEMCSQHSSAIYSPRTSSTLSQSTELICIFSELI